MRRLALGAVVADRELKPPLRRASTLLGYRAFATRTLAHEASRTSAPSIAIFIVAFGATDSTPQHDRSKIIALRHYQRLGHKDLGGEWLPIAAIRYPSPPELTPCTGRLDLIVAYQAKHWPLGNPYGQVLRHNVRSTDLVHPGSPGIRSCLLNIAQRVIMAYPFFPDE